MSFHNLMMKKVKVKMFIHLVGLARVCLRQSRLVIGQFGCSGLPPSDANFGKGEGPAGPSLKVNVNFFQLGTTFFNSWSNQTKLSDCDDYCALNLKVRAIIITSLLKN